MTRILVINAGSSTIKFRLYQLTGKDSLESIAKGSASKLGAPHSPIKIRIQKSTRNGDDGKDKTIEDKAEGETTHEAVFRKLLKILDNSSLLDNIQAIGHRIVHGGPKFSAPLLLTPENLSALDDLSSLAPLHNHPSVMLIKTALEVPTLKDAKNIGVFDTDFHKTLEEKVWRYPLPYDACDNSGLRKYGFHGTSHAYVARKTAHKMGRPLESLNLITLHLGNGASACAIKKGKSYDTSMGFTPLEGLMMGTRSGDIDPSAPYHISLPHFSLSDTTPALPSAPTGPKITKVEDILNHESGLRGICGESDVQKVLEMAKGGENIDAEKSKRAKLALDMFCYRIQKYVGAYYVALSGADALVFTGGIGEHSHEVRSMVCNSLECIGLSLDDKKNSSCDVEKEQVVEIGNEAQKVRVFVAATDEEGEIARIAAGFLNDGE